MLHAAFIGVHNPREYYPALTAKHAGINRESFRSNNDFKDYTAFTDRDIDTGNTKPRRSI